MCVHTGGDGGGGGGSYQDLTYCVRQAVLPAVQQVCRGHEWVR